jgi:hypothetical protein
MAEIGNFFETPVFRGAKNSESENSVGLKKADDNFHGEQSNSLPPFVQVPVRVLSPVSKF